jgi:hypothetical protein
MFLFSDILMLCHITSAYSNRGLTNKNRQTDHPPLYRDSVDMSTVSEHKHLGLVISENESWEKHTDMITAYKRINILRKFKYILDRAGIVIQ